MKESVTTNGDSPSRLIDARIKELDDWRGKTLSHVRALIKQADPEVVEEWSGALSISTRVDVVDADDFKTLIRAAVALNRSSAA